MQTMFVLLLGVVTVRLLRRSVNCEQIALVKLQGGVNNFAPTCFWLKKVEGTAPEVEKNSNFQMM